MKKRYCPDYCGVTCVNGYCPNAREDYEDCGNLPKIRCSDCFFNEGISIATTVKPVYADEIFDSEG